MPGLIASDSDVCQNVIIKNRQPGPLAAQPRGCPHLAKDAAKEMTPKDSVNCER